MLIIQVLAVPAYVIYLCMFFETAEWQLLPSLVAALIIQVDALS